MLPSLIPKGRDTADDECPPSLKLWQFSMPSFAKATAGKLRSKVQVRCLLLLGCYASAMDVEA